MILAMFVGVLSASSQTQQAFTKGLSVVKSDTVYPVLYSRTTNQAVNLIELTDGTNIIFSVSSTGVVGGTSAGASVLQTNFVGAQLYTNTSGRLQQVSTDIVVTTAAVSGQVGTALQINGFVARSTGQSTTTSTVVNSFTNNMTGFIAAGSTYLFTNSVAGAGNSASILNGQLVTY